MPTSPPPARRSPARLCNGRRGGDQADREFHRIPRRSYGSPRVHDELRLGEGWQVGRKRIERLMRINGIVGIHKRRRGCTRRDPDATPSDDLVNRQFTPEGPDRLWVADVTEHPTAKGTVYLAVVVDAWSHRVIGWSIADHMPRRARRRHLTDGDAAAPPTGRPDSSSFRSRIAIHVLSVPTAAARRRRARLDGLDRRRLRQHDCRVVLLGAAA